MSSDIEFQFKSINSQEGSKLINKLTRKAKEQMFPEEKPNAEKYKDSQEISDVSE